MADFCHEFDPGGLGCPHPELDPGFEGDPDACHCPDPCFGDFADAWKDGDLDEIKPGFEMTIGICEGHGTTVVVANIDGKYVMQHESAVDVLIREAP